MKGGPCGRLLILCAINFAAVRILLQSRVGEASNHREIAMDDPKKAIEKKAAKTSGSEQPEPIFPGEVVPENQWEERVRYLREVVHPDNT